MNGDTKADREVVLCAAGEGLTSNGTIFDENRVVVELDRPKINSIRNANVEARPKLRGEAGIIEIKSFQAIDGRPDAAKVAETAMQSAVYVLAIEDLVQALGYPATIPRRRKSS